MQEEEPVGDPGEYDQIIEQDNLRNILYPRVASDIEARWPEAYS